MSEISITFKEGPAYDAPWIVVKAKDADEAYETIQDLRAKHVFEGVKAVAQEFKQLKPGLPFEVTMPDSPAPQAPDDVSRAVKTVLEKIPGSQIIQDTQKLPDSMTPRCGKCEQPAQQKSGVSKQSGVKYDGWFCMTKDCANYWKAVK